MQAAARLSRWQPLLPAARPAQGPLVIAPRLRTTQGLTLTLTLTLALTLTLTRTLGEFAIVNKHLLKDLLERGLWTDEIRNQIIAHNGSVQVTSRGLARGTARTRATLTLALAPALALTLTSTRNRTLALAPALTLTQVRHALRGRALRSAAP